MPVPYQNTGPVDPATPSDLGKLRGKNVVVTGGSSGLGLEYVNAFLHAGCTVTNADVKPPASTPSTSGDAKYQYVECDVRSYPSQVSAFAAAAKLHPSGHIDVVVANAGIAGQDWLNSVTDEDLDTAPDIKILEVNFLGVVYTTKIALHYFHNSPAKAEDKCLVLKSSLAGYLDLIAAPQYQSSKFAVRGLMCNLRRADSCRVAVIAPWFIATPIMSEIVVNTLTERLKAEGSDFALAEDSAKAVIRVASDTSINGRALAIVPRSIRKEGFVDLEWDDYPEGSNLAEWQRICLGMTHRSLPQEQQ